LSAPVVHDGQVYLETSIESSRIEAPIDDSVVEQNDDREEIGRIEAYSLATGEQAWRVEHDGQLRVDSTADETVVIRAIPDDWLREDEAIYALDAATGATHWQRAEDAPTATWSPGALVYCTQPSEQRLRARDPLQGTVEWERTGDVGPAIRAGADGRVVLTTRERVLAIAEATGTVEWEHEVGDHPQPVDAVVDPDRELVYAATRDRPAYLTGDSTTTESTTVLARRLDSGERVWARTCPYYSAGRLALGGDSVYVTSWRGDALAAGCTALDPSTGAVQFRSAIDGTRIATPPAAPESPTLVVERGDAGDGPRLHALTASTAAEPADRGPPERSPGSTTVEIRDATVVAVEHTDTVGVAVTLDPDATTGAQISLTSADGSQSVRVTGTALTEATDDGRLQTASVERGNLPFTPTTCVIETDDTTRTIAIE
jgi:outer membrane protein assembly factor BamB